MCEIDFAKRLGIDLFENAEQVMTFAQPAYIVGIDPRKKVVLKHWRNHEQIDVPKEDLSWADLLILYTNDVITGPWSDYCDAVMTQYNCKNFICVTEGRLNMTDYPQDRVYENHEHHSNKIVNFCRFEAWDLTPNKPKIFDALIGSVDDQIKPHRQFLFRKLQEHRLFNKSFINIWGSINARSPELNSLEDPVIKNFRNSTEYSDKFKNGCSMSTSIPIEVYKRSWYTLVAETVAYNSNYVTEKTAKPLFEKRLFVVFGAQGLLSRLHDLGYQTFHSVIDESYDHEPNDIKRWSMAFDQVLALTRADHVELYKKIQPVLEHNHAWIVNNQTARLQSLKDFLDQHLNKL